jgi:DUF1365 family protein
MESCLYEGRVRHRRGGQTPTAFTFPLAMLYLDLDEIAEVFRGRWCWSTTGPAFAWVRRRDHLGDPRQPLADAVRELVEARTGRRPDGPVRMLTHPRYAGYIFNPLTLFYCFAPDGERLEAVVADVTNTPWRERHQYVLAAPADPVALRVSHEKAFHVSPFLPMTLDYHWSIGRPGPSLALRIAARPRRTAGPADPVFAASLTLRRRPIDSRTLAGVLLRFPLQTAQVIAGIYGQAFRLWLRGARVHGHPRRPAPAVEGGR